MDEPQETIEPAAPKRKRRGLDRVDLIALIVSLLVIAGSLGGLHLFMHGPGSSQTQTYTDCEVSRTYVLETYVYRQGIRKDLMIVSSCGTHGVPAGYADEIFAGDTVDLEITRYRVGHPTGKILSVTSGETTP